jgi:hypothetical protein
MVLIPAGSFQMGDSIGDGWSDERPVHTVTLDSFYMGKYKVETQNDSYRKPHFDDLVNMFEGGGTAGRSSWDAQ